MVKRNLSCTFTSTTRASFPVQQWLESGISSLFVGSKWLLLLLKKSSFWSSCALSWPYSKLPYLMKTLDPIMFLVLFSIQVLQLPPCMTPIPIYVFIPHSGILLHTCSLTCMCLLACTFVHLCPLGITVMLGCASLLKSVSEGQKKISLIGLMSRCQKGLLLLEFLEYSLVSLPSPASGEVRTTWLLNCDPFQQYTNSHILSLTLLLSSHYLLSNLL